MGLRKAKRQCAGITSNHKSTLINETASRGTRTPVTATGDPRDVTMTSRKTEMMWNYPRRGTNPTLGWKIPDRGIHGVAFEKDVIPRLCATWYLVYARERISCTQCRFGGKVAQGTTSAEILTFPFSIDKIIVLFVVHAMHKGRRHCQSTLATAFYTYLASSNEERALAISPTGVSRASFIFTQGGFFMG